MPAVVLIHGLFGWGEERPLCGLGPTYFPLQHLRKLWSHGPVVAVDVGVASSDHDRACEAFAQLLGLRVDYGEEHASQCEHVQYGTIYETGLLEHWDASSPVHLVGHSFGGNSAIHLFHLIAEDYWGLGTGPDWVLSVTCICSPPRGCSLPFACGLEPGEEAGVKEVMRQGPIRHAGATLVQVIWKAQQHWPSLLRPIFNCIDQWQHYINWSSVGTAENALWSPQDNMISEATPRTSALRSRLSNLNKIHLIAVVAGSLEPLAPATIARTCAPYAGIATAAWFLMLVGAWRVRHRALQELKRFLAMRWSRRLIVMVVAWTFTSPCIAALTLFSPQLKRHRIALGAHLQVALEPFRPFLHGWLARPLLRLTAYAVRQSHGLLPVNSPLLPTSSRSDVLDAEKDGEKDGIIDMMSKRGLDAPTIGRVTKLSIPSLKPVRSSTSIHSVRERAHALSDHACGSDDEDMPQQLAKGSWHIIHAPGADHCLGTWLDPHYTPSMYATVFSLLEGSTESRFNNPVNTLAANGAC